MNTKELAPVIQAVHVLQIVSKLLRQIILLPSLEPFTPVLLDVLVQLLLNLAIAMGQAPERTVGFPSLSLSVDQVDQLSIHQHDHWSEVLNKTRSIVEVFDSVWSLLVTHIMKRHELWLEMDISSRRLTIHVYFCFMLFHVTYFIFHGRSIQSIFVWFWWWRYNVCVWQWFNDLLCPLYICLRQWYFKWFIII